MNNKEFFQTYKDILKNQAFQTILSLIPIFTYLEYHRVHAKICTHPMDIHHKSGLIYLINHLMQFLIFFLQLIIIFLRCFIHVNHNLQYCEIM